jgi:hypothetical protein
LKKVALVVGASLFVLLQAAVFAATPNYGYWDLDYKGPNEGDAHGYVQCQPSYLQGDYHAARGWLIIGETKYYTKTGLSKYDSTIYSKGMKLSFTEGPPYLSYGFDWVHKDSPYWPQ